jgi:hypothetical protein
MDLSFIHKSSFKYAVFPLLCIFCLFLTTFVIVQILKETNYMGVRLQDIYSYMFNGKPDDNSQMNVTIKTKDCILEATYSGEAYQKVEATDAGKGESGKCQAFNYENGERPSELTDELVNRELERAYNRKVPINSA